MPSLSGQQEFDRQQFNLGSRFEFIKTLGKGSYGIVCSAFDKHLNRRVAIKRISKLHDSVVLKRTVRELKLLRHLQQSPNIIQILEVLPVQKEDFDVIYVVEELMDADLHTIIRSGQALTERHYQYFLFQILRAVNTMHEAKILHRDLKPGNILVNVDCSIKICDFGLSRGYDEDECVIPITEYVATRWYRAPEIMLLKCYDSSADVWSVGCIFAELLGKKVLFPGKDYQSQIPIIVSKMGPIPASITNLIPNIKTREYVAKLPTSSPPNWPKMYPEAPPEALDLLSKMLEYDPAKRISASEALSHPFLSIYYKDWMTRQRRQAPTPASYFDTSFEHEGKICGFKHVLLEEISKRY